MDVLRGSLAAMSITTVEIQVDEGSRPDRFFFANATLDGKPLSGANIATVCVVPDHNPEAICKDLFGKTIKWLESQGYPVPDNYRIRRIP